MKNEKIYYLIQDNSILRILLHLRVSIHRVTLAGVRISSMDRGSPINLAIIERYDRGNRLYWPPHSCKIVSKATSFAFGIKHPLNILSSLPSSLYVRRSSRSPRSIPLLLVVRSTHSLTT